MHSLPLLMYTVGSGVPSRRRSWDKPDRADECRGGFVEIAYLLCGFKKNLLSAYLPLEVTKCFCIKTLNREGKKAFGHEKLGMI